MTHLEAIVSCLRPLAVVPVPLMMTSSLSSPDDDDDFEASTTLLVLLAMNLLRHIYGQQGKNINISADNSSLAVNPSYTLSWLDLMSRTPLVAPFLSKDSAFITALKKELAHHVVEIYHVASVTFDLLLLLGLGSYLITLFGLLVITTRVVFGGRSMGDWEEGMENPEDGYKSFKI
nr:putative nicalin [Tanacetum cinerariifolium]